MQPKLFVVLLLVAVCAVEWPNRAGEQMHNAHDCYMLMCCWI
jgi:hypothetical protein